MKKRILNLLVAFDKLLYQILTLGYGAPLDTISSAAYRMEQKGRWIGKVSRPVIDWAFSLIGDYDHCFMSYITAKYNIPAKGY